MAELYPWDIIEREYVQGRDERDAGTGLKRKTFPTHEQLCQQYGCKLETIRLRSQTGKWYLQRTQFKRKLRIKNTEINLDDLMGESGKFDAQHLRILEKTNQLMEDFLEPYVNGGYEDLPPLKPRDLKDIIGAIKDSVITVRSILGEPNTASLLDEIKEATLVERKNKEVSKTRLAHLNKLLTDSDKVKEELELRRAEIKKQLDNNTK
jgi:hypothetical protein